LDTANTIGYLVPVLI